MTFSDSLSLDNLLLHVVDEWKGGGVREGEREVGGWGTDKWGQMQLLSGSNWFCFRANVCESASVRVCAEGACGRRMGEERWREAYSSGKWGQRSGVGCGLNKLLTAQANVTLLQPPDDYTRQWSTASSCPHSCKKKKTVPGGPISTLYQCHFKNIPLLEAL